MKTGTQGPADIGNLPTSSLICKALARAGFNVGARLRSLETHGPLIAFYRVFACLRGSFGSVIAIEFHPQR
jgi:hypothetical protein